VEHVAVGTDFDGAITAPIDAGGMPLLTEALLDDGFTAEEVAQIMGGNVLRFLRETLP
jgi:microsomal dipeptidase-like Zn-dependent dipeptidase